MNPLDIYPIHKKILENLFIDIDEDRVRKILDAGSGRTSLYFLTSRFPSSEVDAIVFPGDKRKILAIRNDVRNRKYSLNEVDLVRFSQKKSYDIVLAHLLLGEAGKFGGNNFQLVLDSLLRIDTHWLGIIDIPGDPDVNMDVLVPEARKHGLQCIKEINIDKYRGLLFIKK